jgi:hypothetical protein
MVEVYREDGGSRILRNIRDFIPDCKESNLIRDFIVKTTIIPNAPNKYLNSVLLMKFLVINIY